MPLSVSSLSVSLQLLHPWGLEWGWISAPVPEGLTWSRPDKDGTSLGHLCPSPPSSIPSAQVSFYAVLWAHHQTSQPENTEHGRAAHAVNYSKLAQNFAFPESNQREPATRVNTSHTR